MNLEGDLLFIHNIKSYEVVISHQLLSHSIEEISIHQQRGLELIFKDIYTPYAILPSYRLH